MGDQTHNIQENVDLHGKVVGKKKTVPTELKDYMCNSCAIFITEVCLHVEFNSIEGDNEDK